jgi:hypothetical protein
MERPQLYPVPVPDEAPDDVTDRQFTDDELTALALAADPSERLAADATPVEGSLPASDGPLPGWYMPAVARVVTSPARRTAALLVVGSFLTINAMGLCATYGWLSLG